MARCGDPEGKQVPPSFLLLQLRPQPRLPGQTGALPLAEAPQQKLATPASHIHASGPWPRPGSPCCPCLYLAHLGITSAGARPHPRTLGNPAGARMRQDAQQSLLASRWRFVWGRIQRHWCGLGELRELVLLWHEQNGEPGGPCTRLPPLPSCCSLHNCHPASCSSSHQTWARAVPRPCEEGSRLQESLCVLTCPCHPCPLHPGLTGI